MEQQVPGCCGRGEHDVLQEQIKGQQGQLCRASWREAGQSCSRPRGPVFILRATGSCGRVLNAGHYFTNTVRTCFSGSLLGKARSLLSGRTTEVFAYSLPFINHKSVSEGLQWDNEWYE